MSSASPRGITQRKPSARKIWNLAHTDLLTGLPNRVLLYDRLNQTLAYAKRHGQMFALPRPDFVINGHLCGIGGSIGIALFPDHSETMDALLSCADDAMYQAKAKGKKQLPVFPARIGPARRSAIAPHVHSRPAARSAAG